MADQGRAAAAAVRVPQPPHVPHLWPSLTLISCPCSSVLTLSPSFQPVWGDEGEQKQKGVRQGVAQGTARARAQRNYYDSRELDANPMLTQSEQDREAQGKCKQGVLSPVGMGLISGSTWYSSS
jgi:hypothetical protein